MVPLCTTGTVEAATAKRGASKRTAAAKNLRMVGLLGRGRRGVFQASPEVESNVVGQCCGNAMRRQGSERTDLVNFWDVANEWVAGNSSIGRDDFFTSFTSREWSWLLCQELKYRTEYARRTVNS